MAITERQIANIGTGGESFDPQGFNIEKLQLISVDRSKSWDLFSIFSKLSITESIYSFGLELQVEFIDEKNVIESLPIIGQEIILLEIRKKDHTFNSDKLIRLEFFVTDYPFYTRLPKPYSAAFTINAISPHVFLSEQKKISRSSKQNTVDEIEKILSQDLNLSNIIKKGEAITKWNGIITTSTPLDAMEMLLSLSYDSEYSPFYVFQTLNGNMNILSYSQMTKQESIITLNNQKLNNQQYVTKEYYVDQMKMLLDLTSKFSMSKFDKGSEGTWSSRNFFLDFSNKTFTNSDFSYLSDFNIDTTLEGRKVLKKPNPYNPESFFDYKSLNSKAFGENENASQLFRDSKGKHRVYDPLLDSYYFDIVINGNMSTNPGKVIELALSKATDPTINENIDTDDEYLSGRYCITSAIHNFEDGKYTTNIRVKRDSI